MPLFFVCSRHEPYEDRIKWKDKLVEPGLLV